MSSEPSIESFASDVAALYDAALVPESWPSALERLAETFSCSAVSVAEINSSSKRGDGYFVRLSPAAIQQYLEYYVFVNPLSPLLFRGTLPLNVPVVEGLHIPREELRGSEFYNDWAHPNGLDSLTSCLASYGRSDVTYLGIARAARHGDFDECAIAHFALYTPHIVRALRITRRLRDASRGTEQRPRTLLLEAFERLALGLLIIDRGWRARFINSVADRLMQQSPVSLQWCNGRFECGVPDEASQLNRALWQVLHGSIFESCPQTVKISGSPPQFKPMYVAVLPIAANMAGLSEPSALVLIDAPGIRRTPRELLRQLFGLTSAEATATERFVLEQSVADAASSLSISIETMRTHLKRALDKTGTRSQAELVTVVERLRQLDAAANALRDAQCESRV